MTFRVTVIDNDDLNPYRATIFSDEKDARAMYSEVIRDKSVQIVMLEESIVDGRWFTVDVDKIVTPLRSATQRKLSVILDLHSQGLSVAQIAEKTGLTRQNVHLTVKKADISPEWARTPNCERKKPVRKKKTVSAKKPMVIAEPSPERIALHTKREKLLDARVSIIKAERDAKNAARAEALAKSKAAEKERIAERKKFVKKLLDRYCPV